MSPTCGRTRSRAGLGGRPARRRASADFLCGRRCCGGRPPLVTPCRAADRVGDGGGERVAAGRAGGLDGGGGRASRIVRLRTRRLSFVRMRLIADLYLPPDLPFYVTSGGFDPTVGESNVASVRNNVSNLAAVRRGLQGEARRPASSGRSSARSAPSAAPRWPAACSASCATWSSPSRWRGPVTDAFFVAYRIPNVLRRLLAEGALSTAVIPMFTRIRRRPLPREELHRLVRATLGAALATLTATTLLGIALAPWLLRAIAPGFKSDPPRRRSPSSSRA